MPRAPKLAWTTTADGDLAVATDPAALHRRRAAVVDLPWTWLHQVHGAEVVTVTHPGEHAGASADAAVTAIAGAAVAVHTADCVPVALVADGGVGVVHAGWRGLAAGVVEAAVDALRSVGATRLRAAIGPAIRPRCYEFGVDDIDAVAARVGDGVRATTAWGRPALDVPAGVRAALIRSGVDDVIDQGVCTACSPVHWSHRSRSDTARQALVAWLE